jgi:hypothetical protein
VDVCGKVAVVVHFEKAADHVALHFVNFLHVDVCGKVVIVVLHFEKELTTPAKCTLLMREWHGPIFLLSKQVHWP